MIMSKFTKVVLRNDWGHQYIAPASLEKGPSDSKRALKYKGGEKIRIRYPDGTIETVKVITRTFNEYVVDHGSQYNVKSEVPGFNILHHGIVIWTCLDKVEVDLPDNVDYCKRCKMVWYNCLCYHDDDYA